MLHFSSSLALSLESGLEKKRFCQRGGGEAEGVNSRGNF